MKKGFFEEIVRNEREIETTYEFLRFTPLGNGCVNIHKYLCEYDDIWSLSLTKLKGYALNVVVKYDEELERDVLIHTFNSTEAHGKKIYIDCRGITTELDDILDGLDGEKEKFKMVTFSELEDAKEYLSSLTEEEYVEIVPKEIKDVIATYEEYYIA